MFFPFISSENFRGKPQIRKTKIRKAKNSSQNFGGKPDNNQENYVDLLLERQLITLDDAVTFKEVDQGVGRKC